jgi:hypothetical protein
MPTWQSFTELQEEFMSATVFFSIALPLEVFNDLTGLP